MRENISRRRFLRSAGASAAAALAAPAALSRPAGGGDTVVLAAIGVGGRCTTLIRGLASRSDVRFGALCDVDPQRGGDMLKFLGDRQGAAPRRLSEMRRVLDDRSIDAVVIGTPDHWHGPASILACQAGKHVYVEKPPSHNVWEGRKMVEAARRYDRVVQVGTQNRSAPYAKKALEYIQKGQLGAIHLCKVYNLKPGGPFHAEGESAPPPGLDYDAWLGPAPKRNFSRSHFHGSWHAWWAYSGGDMADDGIHQLDLARWLVGKVSPQSVVATGGKLAFPGSDAEPPDTQLVHYDFGDLLMTFEQTGWAPYMDKIAGDIRNGAGSPYWPQCATRIELYGTKGLMMFGRHGGSWQVFHQAKTTSRQGELVAQELGRFPDPEHQADFLDAIRTRRKPNADIEEGHRSATLVHLANISTRLGGRRLRFDGQSETIIGDAEAAAMLKREYRAPYVVPETV
jgi:predicted dehydrogenase